MPLCFTCFQQHLEVHSGRLAETTYYSRFAHARRSLHSYASTVPVQQCSTNDLPSRLLIFFHPPISEFLPLLDVTRIWDTRNRACPECVEFAHLARLVADFALRLVVLRARVVTVNGFDHAIACTHAEGIACTARTQGFICCTQIAADAISIVL